MCFGERIEGCTGKRGPNPTAGQAVSVKSNEPRPTAISASMSPMCCVAGAAVGMFASLVSTHAPLRQGAVRWTPIGDLQKAASLRGLLLPFELDPPGEHVGRIATLVPAVSDGRAAHLHVPALSRRGVIVVHAAPAEARS